MPDYPEGMPSAKHSGMTDYSKFLWFSKCDSNKSGHQEIILIN